MDYTYLDKMKARLSDCDKLLLQEIYEPKMLECIPDKDAFRSLSVDSEGVIRYYGEHNKKSIFEDGQRCYLESKDCGLSWKRYLVTDADTIGNSVLISSGEYLVVKAGDDALLYAYIGKNRDDASPQRILCSHETFHPKDIFNPIVLSNGRIIVPIHEHRADAKVWTCFFGALLISDDNGRSWHTVKISEAPYYDVHWPDKGSRWQQNNREETIVELRDGRLMMMTRTAMDYHYVSYSSDMGDTWSAPEASVFHSTGTMPKLLKLKDGRLLMFWVNSKLMPEIEGADGVSEDAFTNRDVANIAISSDDGKTWRGYRELRLNPYRNHADFRTVGGPQSCADKSVHQFEVMELPYGKILVVNGQHTLCCRMYIFDVDWLYETKREEYFKYGFENLTTHVFVKSILGNYRGTKEDPLAFVGHCAYNRTDGAFLLPDPRNNGKEVLSIDRLNNDKLVSPVGGAVWNFPIFKKGRIKINARVAKKGLRVSLLDHMINPSDDTVGYFADYSIVLRADMQPSGEEFSDFSVDFDCEANSVTVSCGEYLKLTQSMSYTHPNGLCYLHLQAAATECGDSETLVSGFTFEMTEE